MRNGPSPSLVRLLLVVACALAAVAACSSGGGGSASNEGTGGRGGSRKPDAAAGGTTDGGTIFKPDVFDDGPSQKLAVEPSMATLTLTDKSVPVSQAFKALLGGTEVDATWTLDQYDIGDIDTSGVFATHALLGGVVKVFAAYGSRTASAGLTVYVRLSEDVLDDAGDPGPNPANKGPLMGPAVPDPGPDFTTILYPYDQTVMPRGLIAPVVQLAPGTIVPEDVKVSLRSTYFQYDGYYKVKDPSRPRFTPPQEIWDSAAHSASGSTLDIEVTKAAGGVAYGPAKVTMKVAPGSLKGAVYYMTYETPNNGLWVVKPGAQAPATLLAPGCVVCHSVSANGQRLSTGAEVNQPNPQTGVYRVNGDGTITQLAGEPGGLGGDSRGLSFGVFTPDGKYVTRSQSNFWGGVNTLAWKVDETMPGLVPADVVGLGGAVSALLPAFSPDGKRYGFTNGGAPGQPGTPSRSIGVMDVAVDENLGPAGTLTFSNLEVPLDNGPGGDVPKYVTFLPDSNLIVLQEGGAWFGGYEAMLPSSDGNNYGVEPNKLHFLNLANGDHLELAHANKGLTASDEVHNYEPFALPQPAAGYFWVVFTSIRQYGNIHLPGEERKQLWVTAITPGAAAGVDPSNPPFFLPNQSPTKNERGFWALEPCESDGADCEVDEDCCRGYCRAVDPGDPDSPKTCRPVEDECVPTDEACASDDDCCEVDTGVRCLGGFCGFPIPQ